MGVSSRVSEVTPIVKGMDNIGYLYIHEQGLPLNFFFFRIRVPLVTESLESLSKDISWMVSSSSAYLQKISKPATRLIVVMIFFLLLLVH